MPRAKKEKKAKRYPHPPKMNDVTAFFKYGYGHDKVHGDRALKRKSRHAKHKTHSRVDFIRTLAEHRNDLEVTAPCVKEESEVVETMKRCYRVHMPLLECPNCETTLRNTEELLEHLLEHADNKEVTVLFRNCGVVPTDINVRLVQAVEKQSDAGFIEKRIMDSHLVVKCPVKSPLGSFLTLRSLKVFLNQLTQPPTRPKDELVALTSMTEGTKRCLLFTYSDVERSMDVVHKSERDKLAAKKMEYLMALVLNHKVEVRPLVEKRCAGTSEQKLIVALGLPPNSTQQEIIAACEKRSVIFHEDTALPKFKIPMEGEIEEKNQRENNLPRTMSEDIVQPAEGILDHMQISNAVPETQSRNDESVGLLTSFKQEIIEPIEAVEDHSWRRQEEAQVIQNENYSFDTQTPLTPQSIDAQDMVIDANLIEIPLNPRTSMNDTSLQPAAMRRFDSENNYDDANEPLTPPEENVLNYDDTVQTSHIAMPLNADQACIENETAQLADKLQTQLNITDFQAPARNAESTGLPTTSVECSAALRVQSPVHDAGLQEPSTPNQEEAANENESMLTQERQDSQISIVKGIIEPAGSLSVHAETIDFDLPAPTHDTEVTALQTTMANETAEASRGHAEIHDLDSQEPSIPNHEDAENEDESVRNQERRGLQILIVKETIQAAELLAVHAQNIDLDSQLPPHDDESMDLQATLADRTSAALPVQAQIFDVALQSSASLQSKEQEVNETTTRSTSRQDNAPLNVSESAPSQDIPTLQTSIIEQTEALQVRSQEMHSDSKAPTHDAEFTGLESTITYVTFEPIGDLNDGSVGADAQFSDAHLQESSSPHQDDARNVENSVQMEEIAQLAQALSVPAPTLNSDSGTSSRDCNSTAVHSTIAEEATQPSGPLRVDAPGNERSPRQVDSQNTNEKKVIKEKNNLQISMTEKIVLPSTSRRSHLQINYFESSEPSSPEEDDDPNEEESVPSQVVRTLQSMAATGTVQPAEDEEMEDVHQYSPLPTNSSDSQGPSTPLQHTPRRVKPISQKERQNLQISMVDGFLQPTSSRRAHARVNYSDSGASNRRRSDSANVGMSPNNRDRQTTREEETNQIDGAQAQTNNTDLQVPITPLQHTPRRVKPISQKERQNLQISMADGLLQPTFSRRVHTRVNYSDSSASTPRQSTAPKASTSTQIVKNVNPKLQTSVNQKPKVQPAVSHSGRAQITSPGRSAGPSTSQPQKTSKVIRKKHVTNDVRKLQTEMTDRAFKPASRRRVRCRVNYAEDEDDDSS